MAFVLEQDAIFINLTFKDKDENETSRRFQLRWDVDLATTITNAIAFAATIVALTKSEVSQFSLTLPHADSAATAAADDAENQEDGKISVSLAVDPPASLTEKALISVPAPADGIRLATTGPGSNIIDLTDAAVTAALAAFSSAGEAYLSHGQDAVTLLDGYVHHKRSKRG